MRHSKELKYVAEDIKGVFLSKAACMDLGIIGKDFPDIGTFPGNSLPTNQVAGTIKKCSLADPDNPDKCKCQATPSPRQDPLPSNL